MTTIYKHVVSSVKMYWYLQKLSSENEDLDESRADNSCQKFIKFAH